MKFSAVLLAGGKSSRMGRDKAGLELEGVPLWRRQWETLHRTGAAEVFVAGRAGQFPGDFEVVEDDEPEGGPLTGLIVALRRASHPWLLVLAVDLPTMTPEYLARLVARGRPGRGVIPRRGGRFEPLAALYPREALGAAEHCRLENRRALQSLAGRLVENKALTTVDVAPDEEALFVNVNTRRDWEDFLMKKSGKKG